MVLDVMIIDDDNDIHEYLKKIIDWDGLGLQVICEATDSITALELFSLYHPKIIFMDICISNISGVSGLDLTREFHKQDSDVKVIIITGYTDFEYAKEAVSLGVIDLLSKPLHPETVNASLLKAISLIEKEKNRFLTDSAMEQILNENIDMFRKSRIEYLLKSVDDNSEPQILEQLRLLHLDIAGKKYTVVRIVLTASKTRDINNDLHFAIIRKLLEAKLSANGFKYYIFFSEKHTLDCLISWSIDGGNGKLEELLIKLGDEIAVNFQIKIKAGIGRTVRYLKEISMSALEAEQCVNYFDYELESIVNYKNIKNFEKDLKTSKPENPLKTVEQCLKEKDYEKISAVIDEWFTARQKDGPSIQEMREFSIEYLLLISKMCTNFGVLIWDAPEFNDAMKQVLSSHSGKVLKQLLLSLTYEVLCLIKKRINERNTQKNQLVAMAKKYVKTNLSDKNLGFDNVCDYIGLSKIYFGRLFHKEEGISFNSYINNERISYAKSLLAKTNLRVNEVASKSGFSNSKYFSIIFKSIVSISPLEYRRTKRLDI